MLVLPPSAALVSFVSDHLDTLSKINDYSSSSSGSRSTSGGTNGSISNGLNALLSSLSLSTTTAAATATTKTTSEDEVEFNVLNSYKKIKCIRSFNTDVDGNSKGISLVYNYLYNAGVLSAHKWYTQTVNKQR